MVGAEWSAATAMGDPARPMAGIPCANAADDANADGAVSQRWDITLLPAASHPAALLPAAATAAAAAAAALDPTPAKPHIEARASDSRLYGFQAPLAGSGPGRC